MCRETATLSEHFFEHIFSAEESSEKDIGVTAQHKRQDDFEAFPTWWIDEVFKSHLLDKMDEFFGWLIQPWELYETLKKTILPDKSTFW